MEDYTLTTSDDGSPLECPECRAWGRDPPQPFQDSAGRWLCGWLDRYMRRRYGKGLADMEISDVPGYWHDKEQRLSDINPRYWYRSSYQYLDGRLPNGRFGSPYRTWRVLKAATTAQEGAQEAAGGALAE